MPGKYAYAVIRWMIQRIDDTINHCNLTLNRAGNQHVAGIFNHQTCVGRVFVKYDCEQQEGRNGSNLFIPIFLQRVRL